MKNGVQINSVFFANRGKPAREPLRTLEEMADEFGVTFASLKASMHLHEGPKPEIACRNRRTCQRNWYKPSEMRKWWKSLEVKP